MPLNTSRLSLPYPQASDPANPPSDIQKLAAALDSSAVVFYQSYSSAAPSSPVIGSIWYQTDTRDFYMWVASGAWRLINVHYGISSGVNANPPENPSGFFTGALWYQPDKEQLTVFDGPLNEWIPVGAATLGTAAPSNPGLGNIWYDQTNAGLKVWSGSAWESAQQVNPYLLTYRGLNQVLSTNASTAIDFGSTGTTIGANAPTFSYGTPGVININQSGLYKIDFNVSSNTNNAYFNALVTTSTSLSSPGNATYGGSNGYSTTNNPGSSVSLTLPFANGDSFTCKVYCGGTAVTILGGQGSTFCTVAYIGPIS